MTKNVDIINVAVALIIKAAVLAAGFSGRARKRNLKRLAAMENTQSRINFLLSELLRVVKPGSNIALVSDFLDIDQQTSELLSGLCRHNDVSAFWIHDKSEIEHWPSGQYQILVEGEKVGVDIPKHHDDSWLTEEQGKHVARVESLASGVGIPLLSLTCNRDITAQIVHSLGSL